MSDRESRRHRTQGQSPFQDRHRTGDGTTCPRRRQPDNQGLACASTPSAKLTNRIPASACSLRRVAGPRARLPPYSTSSTTCSTRWRALPARRCIERMPRSPASRTGSMKGVIHDLPMLKVHPARRHRLAAPPPAVPSPAVPDAPMAPPGPRRQPLSMQPAVSSAACPCYLGRPASRAGGRATHCGRKARTRAAGRRLAVERQKCVQVGPRVTTTAAGRAPHHRKGRGTPRASTPNTGPSNCAGRTCRRNRKPGRRRSRKTTPASPPRQHGLTGGDADHSAAEIA